MRLSGTCGLKDVVLGGGVSGNQHLLVRMEEVHTRAGMRVRTCAPAPANDGGISVARR
jgi:hydrogenase maturation factor HypF (carbamoyltransferase family)